MQHHFFFFVHRAYLPYVNFSPFFFHTSYHSRFSLPPSS
uniref:Uncharacterized protein n=1 Tax=Rhizophora mucronata TaxID=61149 RepID=A0A2P2KP03_RHIMU